MTEKIQITTLDTIDAAAQQFISNVLEPAKSNAKSTIVAFYGQMGAGKTTFIRALCQQLGVSDEVTSPTFAIVNEYEPETGDFQRIYHFDFYRIKRLEEVYDMGYEEYFYEPSTLCLIEWPELIEELLPADSLRIQIAEQADGARTISPIV